MKLVVNHNEITQVQNDFLNNYNELNTEIDKWLSEIARLREIWKGTDSDIFCKGVEAYFAKVKTVSILYYNFGKFLNKANNSYKERDEAFANDLKKVSAVKE